MWTWERLEKLTEKYAPALCGVLLVYTFLRSILAGTAKVYWYDELLTQIVTAQSSVSNMMSALRGPLDGQPPLFYIIEKLASKMVANQDLALRLPAAVAIVCTMLCVYIFLHRQSGRLIALLSVMFLMTTPLFRIYASEARPYSLFVACMSFALVCYQRAPAWKWVVMLGASLALAESLSYLAVLSIIPFVLAELAASLRWKKVRWGVWTAFASAAFPLVLCWKLVVLNKGYYGPHHVALGFNLARIPHSYGDLLSTDGAVGMGIAISAAMGIAITWRKPPTENDESDPGERKNDRAVILGLLGLPFIAYFFVLATHGPMAWRYLLPCILGMALGFGWALARLPKQAVAVFAAFVLGSIGVTELHFWRYLAADRRELANKSAATVKILERVGHPQLPVVMPSGDVLWVAQYAFPRSPGRFVYLTKEPGTPGDTTDKSISIAQRYVPVQVRDVSAFVAANSEFLIFVDGESPAEQWITLRLLQQGWSVELLAVDGPRSVCLVSNEKKL